MSDVGRPLPTAYRVERVQLRELALAGEAQADDQKAVDKDRPDHLFHDRERR